MAEIEGAGDEAGSDSLLEIDSAIRLSVAAISDSSKETSRRARRRRRSSCTHSKRLIRISRSAITSFAFAGLFH